MLANSIRSDGLAHLRGIIARSAQLAQSIDVPLQIRVVIDTNVVLADLLWLAGKRTDPAARRALQEGIQSGTLIAFVPNSLRDEVEEHLPELAQERGIDEDRLWKAWAEYQQYLRFYPVVAASFATTQPIVDHDDLPFIWLSLQVGARAIVSRDGHISAMGGAVVAPEVLLDLREYARAASVELTIKQGAYGVTLVLSGSTYAFIHLATALVRGVARLPLWIQLMPLLGAGIVLLHSRSRATLAQALHDGYAAWQAAITRLTPLLVETGQTLGREGAKAAAARRRIEGALPRLRRIPLETVVFAVCLAAGTPLTLDEIMYRVRASGYTSQSRYFHAYLSRVVRQSTRLVPGADGRWSAATPERSAGRLI